MIEIFKNVWFSAQILAFLITLPFIIKKMRSRPVATSMLRPESPQLPRVRWEDRVRRTMSPEVAALLTDDDLRAYIRAIEERADYPLGGIE